MRQEVGDCNIVCVTGDFGGRGGTAALYRTGRS